MLEAATIFSGVAIVMSIVTLRRGFKAQAERTATALRAELGLQPHERLDITDLAKHLNVAIVSASELIDVERLEELERIQAFAFSACSASSCFRKS